MQIPASPDETNTTDVLHDLSQKKPRNSTSNGSCTRHHTQTTAPRTRTRAAADSRLLGQISVTRAAKKALSSTNLHGLRIWWSYDMARTSTRHLGFWHLLHAPMDLARAKTLLLTSPDDVITPCQQPRKHIHVSKSHVNPRHVRQPRQQCRLVSTTSPGLSLTRTDLTRTTWI